MMRRTSAATLVALVACRLGGPSADPEAYISFPDDGGADASTDDVALPAIDEGGSAGDGGVARSSSRAMQAASRGSWVATMSGAPAPRSTMT